MLGSLLLHGLKGAKDVADKLVGTHYDPFRDIVVVTGGSGGLGRELVALFRHKNTTVISLDIRSPPQEAQLPGVQYIECDVSDKTQVWEAHSFIRANYGPVSVLINNAGVTCGKKLVELDWQDIDKIIQVNLISSFYTIKTFLPDMLAARRGYVVTIGSVLGYMSPAKLSVYGASKSGLVALHESLTYELGSPMLSRTGVKTLLVCPGQLQTSMFGSIATPSQLLAPELDPAYVAAKIVKAITLGQRGEMKLPFYGNFVPLFRAFPWPVVELVRKVSGIDKSMEAFVSRAASIKDAASLISLIGTEAGNNVEQEVHEGTQTPEAKESEAKESASTPASQV